MAVSKIYPPPLTPPQGSKVKYLKFAITKAIVNIFAEILHTANILPTHTPSTQGVGSKGQTIFFLKVVMLYIKLKLTTLALTWCQLFCKQTNPRLRGWGQKVKLYLFLKVVKLHNKLKGIEHRAP